MNRKCFVSFVLFNAFFSALSCNFFKEIAKGIKKITEVLENFNDNNCEKLQEIFDNFYTVENGKFYRSQQLSRDVLDYYLKEYKIKTLISLRWEDPEDWKESEELAAKNNGALFFNICMSAYRLSRKEDLIKLLYIYETAPKPILVHCAGGADRTGEASALWVLEIQKKSKKIAKQQLSLKYGHRVYKNSAKDFLIDIWGGKEWLLTVYNPDNYIQFKK